MKLYHLTKAEVVEALNNNGYVTTDDEILSARVAVGVRETPVGVPYDITFRNDDGYLGVARIWLDIHNGKLVAEY